VVNKKLATLLCNHCSKRGTVLARLQASFQETTVLLAITSALQAAADTPPAAELLHKLHMCSMCLHAAGSHPMLILLLCCSAVQERPAPAKWWLPSTLQLLSRMGSLP
jgi:hypothetical protein